MFKASKPLKSGAKAGLYIRFPRRELGRETAIEFLSSSPPYDAFLRTVEVSRDIGTQPGIVHVNSSFNKYHYNCYYEICQEFCRVLKKKNGVFKD